MDDRVRSRPAADTAASHGSRSLRPGARRRGLGARARRGDDDAARHLRVDPRRRLPPRVGSRPGAGPVADARRLPRHARARLCGRRHRDARGLGRRHRGARPQPGRRGRDRHPLGLGRVADRVRDVDPAGRSGRGEHLVVLAGRGAREGLAAGHGDRRLGVGPRRRDPAPDGRRAVEPVARGRGPVDLRVRPRGRGRPGPRAGRRARQRRPA